MARTITKILAVAPGHSLHREQVADLLWPDLPPDVTRARLSKMVHLARHALEPGLDAGAHSSYLRSTRELLFLDSRHVWVDADHFEQAANTALAGDATRLEAVLTLYKGELLPEDRYADWAAGRREALAELYRRLLLALASALETAGEHSCAAERLEQLLGLDPAAEEVHRRLMRLYLLEGHRHLAIR
jgi:DNA-binding SARP family transcriptional activator